MGAVKSALARIAFLAGMMRIFSSPWPLADIIMPGEARARRTSPSLFAPLDESHNDH
jgi:hypothetical protein